ncbi:MAG: hypothetical protein AAGC46_21490, partial [Solirubrobacteraceae bacterium]
MTAPVVVDAAGNAVPATLSVDGDDVVFTVTHRAAGTTYPVLADPSWFADYDFSKAGQGNGGLFFDNPGGGYDLAGVTGGDHPGITIQPLGGRVYTSADYARAFFNAPPGSTIDKVDFLNVFRVNDLDRQTMRLALYGPGGNQINDYSSNTPFSQPTLQLDDPTDTARSALVWMSTPACGPLETNCPRLIPTKSPTRVTVGRMIVTMIDPGAPAITMSGGLTQLGDGWIKGEGTSDLTVNFTDDGSGVQSWRVQQGRGAARSDLADPVENACDTRHADPQAEAFPCPQSDQFTDHDVDLSRLLEGRISIIPSAIDFAKNPNDGAGSTLHLRIDRTPPKVDSVGGALITGNTSRWQQIRGTRPLDVDLSDTYSGVKQVVAKVTPITPSGPASDYTVDTCTPPGDVDQPCPTSIAPVISVDADKIPDGEVEVSATAKDYVGYDSEPTAVRIFKDNTNPAATAKGELTDLEDEWTNSTRNTPVTLEGKDRRSGISRLELYARDDAGRRLVDDIQVCDPADIDASHGETCPQQISRRTDVDLGDLDTGPVTLEAYATDAAGNRDPTPDSWDTYIDHDAPTEVSHVTAVAGPNDTTRISWNPATDEGSGLDDYEYRLSVDDRTTDWVTTPFPGATLPTELQRAIVEVRAKDKTGNRGKAVRESISLDPVSNVLAVCKSAASWAGLNQAR